MDGMQAFAALLERLVLTPSRNAKLALICDYLRHTPDPSRGWALAAITGDLDIPSVKPAAIRELVAARVDPVLFGLSYDYVGDLAETISLIWPHRPGANRAPDLSEVVETLLEFSKAQGLKLVEDWLDALDATGRWALLKLVTGGMRVGVSARLARQAAADFGQGRCRRDRGALARPSAALSRSLRLARRPRAKARLRRHSRPSARPCWRIRCSPSPSAPIPTRSTPLTSRRDDFAAEWKWDGVRVQLASEAGVAPSLHPQRR